MASARDFSAGEPLPRPGRAHPDWICKLFSPVSIAPLVWFRIAFGIIMLWEVCRYFAYGWIFDDFIEPTFFFSYYGFEWIKPWPGWGMYIHFAVMGLSAIAIALGLFYRAATVVFFVGFTCVFLLDETHYLNHFYLVCLYSFLLMFVPAHRAFSLDVKLRRRAMQAMAPTWTLWILRAQIGIVYFMGGIAKLSPDWLRGEPMGIWLRNRTDFPVIGRYFTEAWAGYLFSYAGLFFDLLIVPMVIWRRTRWAGFALAAIFNIINARLFTIGIFPWLSLGATLILFIDPKWLPRPFRSVWGKPDARSMESGHFQRPLSRGQLVTTLLLGCWLAFQTLFPLRHLFLYPGSPEWTEEGHRFAWRMKLRAKAGVIEINARDPVSGRSWKVSPEDYLTADQAERSADQPDMILQFCHHIADKWRREHKALIEVRVSARASLNGRRLATLIDPDVDLAAQPRTLWHASWILPLHLPLREGGQKPGRSDMDVERSSPSR